MYEYALEMKKKKECVQRISDRGTIQRRGYTSDELAMIVRQNYERIVEEKQDPEYIFSHVDDHPDWVVEVLRALKILNYNDFYNDNPGDEEDDPDYKGMRSRQYLNPTTLRKNMGKIGAGGEAHHIIPSSIAKGLASRQIGNASFFNGAWNGVLLNGTIKGGQVLNPLKGGFVTALHRKNGQRNHPKYSFHVDQVLKGTKTIKQVQYVAENYLRPKIAGLAGKCIEDIR